MLNLRQLGSPTQSTAVTDAEFVSNLSSAVFRATTHIIGNIGEPLDHSQAGRYIADTDDDWLTEEDSVTDHIHDGIPAATKIVCDPENQLLGLSSSGSNSDVANGDGNKQVTD